jgi:alpha-tubulin suppressor-like RCC1 family protein
VNNLPAVTQISAFNTFSLALGTDGTVWSWGSNSLGQLGNGTSLGAGYGTAVPLQVKDATGTSTLVNIVAVSAGDTHALALQNDGTLWAWGNNGNGRLGDGSTSFKVLPVQVSGFGSGSGVAAISAGQAHSLALKNDGSVWAWGSNSNGQIGDGTTTLRGTPVQVSGLGAGSGVVAIAAGTNFSLALKANGTVWAWGANFNGQLGDGTFTQRVTPVQGAGLLSALTAIAANGSAYALKSDGTVWAWGPNFEGELGDGTTTTRSLPVQVLGAGGTGVLTGATAVAAGPYHGGALLSDGSVWNWGQGLGIGDDHFNNGSFPVQAQLTQAVGIAAGGAASGTAAGHTMALVPETVPTVQATLATSPSGLQVTIDGFTYTAPQNLTWLAGTCHDGNIQSPQYGSSGIRYAFTGVVTNAAGSGCTPTPAAPTTYTANFSAQYLLTTSASPASGGSIAASPSSSDGFYDSGTSVQLTAIPETAFPFGFDHWTGDLNGSTNPQTLSMTAPHTVTGNFVALTNITVNTSPAGLSILVDGSSHTSPYTFQWAVGSSHTIATTSPQAGPAGSRYAFGTWSDAGAMSHSVMTPASATIYTANFTTQYLLTTSVFPVSSGTVAANPSSTDGYYNSGTSVLLTATPASSFVFANWTGGITGSANPQSVLMNNAQSVTANFLPPTSVTLNTLPAGLSIQVDGSSYTSPQSFLWAVGSSHTIATTSPQAVSAGLQDVFMNWSDAGAISHTVTTPASAMTYTANFLLGLVPVPSRVLAWGTNGVGELGYVNPGDFTPQSVRSLGPGSGVVAVAAGLVHSLSLQSNGAVQAWGLGDNGRLGNGTPFFRTTPEAVSGLGAGSGVIAIAAGNAFSMALKSDGTVLTWGFNFNGQIGNGTNTDQYLPVQVTGLGPGSGVIAIAAGSTSAYALKGDGTVWAWGSNANGELGNGTTTQQLIPVQVLILGSNVTAIFAGSSSSHALALKSDSSVWAWGFNGFGQLGDGTTTSRTSPVGVTGFGAGSGIVALAAGASHSLGLKSDGSVFAWGSNGAGQLGDGTQTQRLTPNPVSGLGSGGAIAITAGGGFSLAVKSDGSALGWGRNTSGQLGNGTMSLTNVLPALVPGLTALGLPASVTGITAGVAHALALSSGGVLGWGSNNFGALGRGRIFDAHGLPGLVNNLPPVTQVSGFDTVSLALGTDGTVWSWGSNSFGQLGNGIALGGTGYGTAVPVQVKDTTGTSILSNIVAVATGDSHALALQNDGTLWAWGNNGNGRLGDGTTTSFQVLPVQVSGFGPGSGVVAISAGIVHNLALKSDGSVWAWGFNGSGQLGDGTTTQRPTPVQVSGLGAGSGVVAIAAGTNFSFALKADGTVWAWGANFGGQLGDGTFTQRVTPVQVKAPSGTGFLSGITAIVANGSTYVLKSDGTVWAWGNNGAGELGDGTTTTRSLPVQVLGAGGTGFLTGATAVAAGAFHGGALLSDGTAWNWGQGLGIGNNQFNNTPYPVQATLSQAVAIAAGGTLGEPAGGHSMALVPMTVPVVTGTLATSPSGLQVSVDGVTYIAPQILTWLAGTCHDGDTQSPQYINPGTRWLFTDVVTNDPDLNACIPTPTTPTTYTVNFSAQYLLTTSVSPTSGGSIAANPSSSDGFYDSGTSVQLTGTAATGFTFDHWTGDLTGSTNPQSLSMTAPHSVTGNFVGLASITVNTSPAGLSIQVDGASYTSPQTFQWVVGSSHTIATTSPQAGPVGSRYAFGTWSDAGALSHSVMTPASGTTYTANFTTQYLLTTSVSPALSGTIAANPSSTDGYYNSGTPVQVTATPASNFTFGNWTGGITGSTNPQSVLMNNAQSVTANFVSANTVTVNTSPAGLSIQVDGASYTAPQTFQWLLGSTHTIATTSPQAGPAGSQYAFVNWSDGGAISHVVAPTSPAVFTASFSLQFKLTTTASPSGAGTISALPSSTDGYYNSGSSVQLTAVPAPGDGFGNWSGDLTGTANPQSIVMSASRSVTANFVLPVNITVNSAPAGRIFIVDSVTYTTPQTLLWVPGSVHTIATASPQTVAGGTQYVFLNWSDAGALSHQVTAPTVATTYTVNFNTQYQLTTAVFPSGAGTVSPVSGGFYNAGQVVPVSVTPSSGFHFTSWTGPVAAANSASTSVTMNAPESITANFTTAAPTTLVLTTPPNPSVFGQTVSLTATVTPGSAPGKVTFYDGPNVLGVGTISNGKAVLQTSLLPAGNHSLHAFYPGNVTFSSSNSPVLPETVNSAPQYGFAAPVGYGGLGRFPFGVVVADFNGDGYQDLAVTSQGGNTVSIFLGTVSGAFQPAINFSAGSGPGYLAVGDLNEDGIPDLVINDSGNVNVLLGNGDGSFHAPVPYPTSQNPGYVALVLGDFNGDGHVDVAKTNWGSPNISVFLGNGDGTLQPPVNYGIGSTPAGYGIAEGDFNGDGKTDLAVGMLIGSSPKLTILLGAGDGSFQVGGTYNTDAGGMITVADLNGDGLSDLVVAGPTDHAVKVMLGNGNGTFQQPVPYTLGISEFAVAVGDFNGDGWVDVIVGDYNPNASDTPIEVVLGNGDGTLQNPVSYDLGQTTGLFAVGEFNGDGRSDLAVTTGAGLSILLGAPATRTMTFTTVPPGLGITVDNVNYITPQTFAWAPGSAHTIAATSPQPGGPGTQFAFANWSDSGAISHAVTAPAVATTYTANFNTQYQLSVLASPAAGGTVTPATGNFFDAGSTVSVQATANAGYQFAGFSNGLSGTTNPAIVTMSGPLLVVANFTPIAPNLAASVGTRVDGAPGTRLVTINLTNTGLGTATNATITSITGIADVAGSGTVTVAGALPLDIGSIAPSTSAAGTITFNWPTTATRVRFTINFAADGGYTGASTVTTFR